jgi:alpha-mannosidase
MSERSWHLVVVPHTHWDREWYRTHEQFRVRLVRLVDRLLDLLEGDPAYRHFTLDGQSSAVADYLEVRPGARERIAKLVRDGRLLVGPWFVLPDEWLVSGEALIRNLRLGLRQSDALGTAMRLGYVPDQFGHVGQLPQIFAGFGFDAAVLWRGVGDEVETTPFWWEGRDGTRLLTVYLPQGYGNAAQLPLEPDALRSRLQTTLAAQEPFAAMPSLLLMNGSDHQEPQAGLPAALEAALDGMPGVTAEIGTLPGFVERARREATGELSLHCGELRSGLRSPLLPGCASTRAPQKRQEFANDRLLTRVLEPLAAWLGALGGDPDPEILELAWRVALENHPHDSVCGCSIDAVHDQMETRFARVREIATAHLERVAGELAARMALPTRGFGRGAGEPLFVWNPNGGGPALVEGEIFLAAPTRGGSRASFHLRDADGRRIPVAAELLAPEQELFALSLPKGAASLLLGAFGDEVAAHPVRAARLQVRERTLHLDLTVADTPSGYDAAEVRRAVSEALARDDDVEQFSVVVRKLPRLRLRFADDLPGHGLRSYRIAGGRARPRAQASVSAGSAEHGGAWIENAHWRIEADAAGHVRMLRRADGLVVDDALRLVSEGDRGDEYNFDPVPGAPLAEHPERVRVRATGVGEAAARLEIEARYRVPESLTPDRAGRAERTLPLSVRLRLELFEDNDRVDLDLELDNRARDHRLRLHVRAPFSARRFQVESAFELVDRPIAPESGAFGSEHPSEFPIGAVPQRAFASLLGDAAALTVANRGVAEVEAVPEVDGRTSLALTVLRAVGWLSREDLALRPGHAGPPLETPGAQVPGTHRVELSLRWHAPDEPERVLRAHAHAYPPVPFAGGAPGPGPLRDGQRLVEVDDPAVVVSAIEPRADGRALVRLWNASPEARTVRVRWGGEAGRLELMDLAERPLPGAAPAGDGAEIQVELSAWRIATLRA